MQEIRGVISDVVYTNEQNGYSIVEIETEGNLPMVVTGTIPFPGVGETIEAKGNFVNHAVYGQQFKATQIVRSYPQDMNSLYLFLASGSFKGIGLATARRIINTFGTDSIQILENEPHRLAEIKGITPKKAQEIGEGFRKHTALRALTEFLATNGLEPALAMDLYRRYGQDALPKLLSNPYLLITLDLSHNFRAVDALAMKQGLTTAAPQRIDSALLFLLSDAGDSGHVALPRDLLESRASSLLGLSQEDVSIELSNAISVFLIIEDQGLCYLPSLYKAECHVAERLASLAKIHFKVPKGLTRLIEESEESLLVHYSEQQITALRTAAEYGLMVLTGGPGTGKTTSIRGIIALLEHLGAEVALAAPTGRAAKRMSELCDREAKTIHRLLEVTVDGYGQLVFNRNATNPLPFDVVILDELSMVDLELMSSLLAALKESARLILVGDADQLPSVGAGNVLADILQSGVVHSVHLNEIFRQAHESLIVVGAHQVNQGMLPPLREKKGDLFFLGRRTSREMCETIVDLVTNRLPNRMQIPPEDIQVLLPNRRDEGGTEMLNPMLQAAVNPPSQHKREVKSSFSLFREGDRVMQTANNYELEWRKNDSTEMGTGIFNGDTGIILSIDKEAKQMVIRFDERTAIYTFDMLDQLELSYATTVHKAQGSEYPVVIFGATLLRSRLLNRSLFYTAMTRAKNMLILVGREDSIATMVENSRRHERYGLLSTRLQNAAKDLL